MSTIKKTSSIIVSAVIIAGIAFGLVDYLKPDQNEILHQFTLDAVYLKNDQIVKISFEDKSNNTKSAVLEINTKRDQNPKLLDDFKMKLMKCDFRPK